MDIAFGFLPTLIILVYLGLLGVGIYIAILLIKFLVAGTEAFKIYIDKNKE